jgi:hypothetical protein
MRRESTVDTMDLRAVSDRLVAQAHHIRADLDELDRQLADSQAGWDAPTRMNLEALRAEWGVAVDGIVSTAGVLAEIIRSLADEPETAVDASS